MKKSYRSPGLRSGFFNKMGTIHMHIDAPGYEELVLTIVKELEKMGNPSKLNYAIDFIAGNQRKIYPKTYEVHTPNIEGEEQLDLFSTTFIKDRENAIEILNFVNKKLVGTKGVIIELEQVVGWMMMGGSASKILIPNGEAIEPIQPSETDVPRGDSLSFEIHHRFDLPKLGSKTPPQLFDSLLQFCEEMSIEIGGWFVFEKEHSWAFRSNAFTNGERLLVADKERALIDDFLNHKGGFFTASRVETCVERIIGIWNT